jgi:hypothetical protein
MKETESKIPSQIEDKQLKLVLLISIVAVLSALIFGSLGYFLRETILKKETVNITEVDYEFPDEVFENEELVEIPDETVEDQPSSKTPEQKDQPEQPKQPSQSEKKPEDKCSEKEEEVLALVQDFIKYQEERNAGKILSLFTEAKTESEKKDFQYLTGQDTGVGTRLFNNKSVDYQTKKVTILERPATVDNNCIVKIGELRSYSGSPEDPSYQEPKELISSLELSNINNQWKIEKYQSLDTSILEGKYSGFLMIYK